MEKKRIGVIEPDDDAPDPKKLRKEIERRLKELKERPRRKE